VQRCLEARSLAVARAVVSVEPAPGAEGSATPPGGLAARLRLRPPEALASRLRQEAGPGAPGAAARAVALVLVSPCLSGDRRAALVASTGARAAPADQTEAFGWAVVVRQGAADPAGGIASGGAGPERGVAMASAARAGMGSSGSSDLSDGAPSVATAAAAIGLRGAYAPLDIFGLPDEVALPVAHPAEAGTDADEEPGGAWITAEAARGGEGAVTADPMSDADALEAGSRCAVSRWLVRAGDDRGAVRAWLESSDAAPSLPDLDEDGPLPQCVVCIGADATTALVPCGHTCMCAGCAVKVTACPVCRKTFDFTFTVDSAFLTGRGEAAAGGAAE